MHTGTHHVLEIWTIDTYTIRIIYDANMYFLRCNNLMDYILYNNMHTAVVHPLLFIIKCRIKRNEYTTIILHYLQSSSSM